VPVNVGNLDFGGLMYPEAASIHQGKADPMPMIGDVAEEITNPAIRQYDRQPFLLRLANLFFPNNAQSRLRDWQ
jgi:hypothetical protein